MMTKVIKILANIAVAATLAAGVGVVLPSQTATVSAATKKSVKKVAKKKVAKKTTKKAAKKAVAKSSSKKTSKKVTKKVASTSSSSKTSSATKKSLVSRESYPTRRVADPAPAYPRVPKVPTTVEE